MNNRNLIPVMLLFCLLIFNIRCSDVTAPKENNTIHPTKISGPKAGFLSADSSPYLVTDNLIVEENTQLTIQGDTRIWFSPGTQLLVHGTLTAEGERGKPIIFTDSTSSWMGVKFKSAQAISSLDYCVIENVNSFMDSRDGFGAVDVENSTVQITHSIFRKNYTYAGGGLAIDQSWILVKNNIFHDNQTVLFGGAIYCEESTLTVMNNTFYHNSAVNYGGGIAIQTNDSLIAQNNIFLKNASKAPKNDFYGGSIYSYKGYNFTGTDEEPPGFSSLLDFRLQPRSLCIDAGNPAVKYNDPDGSRNDQGAYGGPLGDGHINY